MKLPMRFRIIHLVSQHDTISDKEVMEALRDEYGGEGQYKDSIINTHLMSLRAVGIIEVAGVSLDDNNELVQEFKITDYGTNLLNSYLPSGWK
jgi:hypothetical protein